ncbi:hypothetical protein HY407_01490 [Candidatus Gottesmanbacteria bacterium]|nr:hypothetical protein [Candidatus Gottesmanbacteria bacterium]
MDKLKLKKSKKRLVKMKLDSVQWEKVEKIFAPDKERILKSLARDKESYPYTQDVLKLLAAGAIITLSFAVPTFPMVIAPFVVGYKEYQRYRLNQTIGRLKKKKLIDMVEKDGYTIVKINKNGIIRALSYKLEDIKIDKPKRWDRKWRIVIFDIPEKSRNMRDNLRARLKLMGFYNLQESVWVHPYPCFDQVEFLRQIYHVDINVRYIIADQIEDADDLVSHFHLVK